VHCNFVGHHEDIANRSTQFRVFQLLKELLSTLLEDVTKVSIDTTCWSKGKSCYLFIFSSMNFAEFFLLEEPQECYHKNTVCYFV
jgi:hypothetical protein